MIDPDKITALRKARADCASNPCGSSERSLLIALADVIADMAELRPMLDLSPAINTDNFRKFALDKSQ